LPPSIVLEVLLILENEISLRDETRVAEQAKLAVSKDQRAGQTQKLSKTQDALRDRVLQVTQRIRELEDGPTEFAEEIGLLTSVGEVMQEATEILLRETGARAIGAETDAIELLLQSKRMNPNGSGGSGSSPGGGGGGTTNTPAIALIGRGANDKEVREDHNVSQSTGDSGASLPEEFRGGLDEYFNRLEKSGGN
jgi:hypothetical protein